MESKFLIHSSLIYLFIGLNSSDGHSDSVAISVEDTKSFRTQLNACSLKGDFTKITELQGPKVSKKTVMKKVKKGDKGKKGMQGPRGLPGFGPGLMGKKGDRGSLGYSGINGKDGTCFDPCLLKYSEGGTDDSGKLSEGMEMSFDFGLPMNPSPSLCHVQKNVHKFKGKIWVNPKKKFQVYCEEESNRTCLMTTPVDKSLIMKEVINYTNEPRSFWLSEKKYNIQQLYSNLEMDQIEWLQNHASSVTQKLRYHCKNSYIDQPEKSLRMFGWTDVLIGMESDLSPQIYAWQNHGCTNASPKNEWLYSDLIIHSQNPRVLPVIDFQIRDIRDGQQLFNIELLELCFE